MSFINQRNKLKYIQNQKANHIIFINRQDNNNKEIIQDYNSGKTIFYTSKKINTFHSEWTDLATDTTLNIQYITWTLEFEVFDIRFLPFFDIKFLYRRGETIAEDSALMRTPLTQTVFQIEDLAEVSDYYKKVTLKANLEFTGSGHSNIYQGRMFCYWINPCNFN